MNHNYLFYNELSSTSSFISYTDYSSTSVTNSIQMIFKYQINCEKPNQITLYSIFEANNFKNLKKYKNIDEFFNDLEN